MMVKLVKACHETLQNAEFEHEQGISALKPCFLPGASAAKRL